MNYNLSAELILRNGEARGRAFVDSVYKYHEPVPGFEGFRSVKVYEYRPGLYAILTGGNDPRTAHWSYLRLGETAGVFVGLPKQGSEELAVCEKLCNVRKLIYLCGYADESMLAKNDFKTCLPGEEGYEINLGADAVLKVMRLRGTSLNGVAVIDPVLKVAFTGDALCSDFTVIGDCVKLPAGNGATLETYNADLKKLASQRDKFDFIFPFRGAIDFESYVIDYAIEETDKMLEDPAKASYTATGENGQLISFRICMAPGTIVYSETVVR